MKMAQIYIKPNKIADDTFNATQLLFNSSEVSKVKDTAYFEVLDMFRKVFKGIKFNDLFL